MRQLWLGSILLSTALSSPAVTLGSYSGAAIIGRPLDIRIQAMLAPGDSDDSLCLRTEVFFGESQITQVMVGTQRLTPDADLIVRVQTSAPVNEPFVTVKLTAGCAASFTRSFMLLADPEVLAQTTAQAAQAPVPVSSAVPLPGESPVADAATQPRPSGAAAPATRQARATPRAAAPASSRRATAPKNPATAPKTGVAVRKPGSPTPVAPAGPRLELDPIDLSPTIERDPVLRMSPMIVGEPTGDEQARQAAMARWKAINASAEDVLSDARRVAALEAEAKVLREQASRSREEVAALQGKLEEGARYRTVSLILGGTLLAALLAALWVWRRSAASGRAPAWWAGVARTAEQDDEPEQDRGPARKLPARLPASLRERKPSSVDLDLSHDEDSSLTKSRAAAAYVAPMPRTAADSDPRRDFGAAGAAQGRSVATEELFDVQQQADFFVSLGQHEQAISILKAHLDESHEPSPLAYLDLLNIYHSLGRKLDYEALREDFNQVFNAGAPPFDDFSQGSRGLESYEAAFSRIQALWPQRKVLDLIERSIFRDPQATDGEVFDLAAYRELLFLHAVAKEIVDVRRDDDDADLVGAVDFQHTALKPLKVHPSVNGQENATLPEGDRVTEPMQYARPMSSNIGLDVDLDALATLSALETSLPDIYSPTPSAPQLSPTLGEQGPGTGKMGDLGLLDFVLPAEDRQPPPKQ